MSNPSRDMSFLDHLEELRWHIIRSTISFYHDKDILDICAAPGGKSILLQSFGFTVRAIDKSQNQINKFSQLFKGYNGVPSNYIVGYKEK